MTYQIKHKIDAKGLHLAFEGKTQNDVQNRVEKLKESTKEKKPEITKENNTNTLSSLSLEDDDTEIIMENINSKDEIDPLSVLPPLNDTSNIKKALVHVKSPVLQPRSSNTISPIKPKKSYEGKTVQNADFNDIGEIIKDLLVPQNPVDITIAPEYLWNHYKQLYNDIIIMCKVRTSIPRPYDEEYRIIVGGIFAVIRNTFKGGKSYDEIKYAPSIEKSSKFATKMDSILKKCMEKKTDKQFVTVIPLALDWDDIRFIMKEEKQLCSWTDKEIKKDEEIYLVSYYYYPEESKEPRDPTTPSHIKSFFIKKCENSALGEKFYVNQLYALTEIVKFRHYIKFQVKEWIKKKLQSNEIEIDEKYFIEYLDQKSEIEKIVKTFLINEAFCLAQE